VDWFAKRGGVKTPEQEVADILPLEVDPVSARRVLGEVPFWFHTFTLNRGEGIYTPGVAVDHRYRLPFLPASFATMRVLDVGTFDGFYAFVAEARGAERVVAVDSEQHVAWVHARWGIEALVALGTSEGRLIGAARTAADAWWAFLDDREAAAAITV
jgi:predicted nicotinamide N-methyase